MNTYNIDKMYENYSSEIERMQKFIDKLEQENKKYKEVIEKSREYINSHLKQDMLSDFTGANYIQEYISEPDALLDILKEVE